MPLNIIQVTEAQKMQAWSHDKYTISSQIISSKSHANFNIL